MTDPEFLERLRELCIRFDATHGEYPETQFQGLSLLRFAEGNDRYYDPDGPEVAEWKGKLKL